MLGGLKMFCDNAYYPKNNGRDRERLYCKNTKNTYNNGKCPFIYYCKINERFENTAEAVTCIFREE